MLKQTKKEYLKINQGWMYNIWCYWMLTVAFVVLPLYSVEMSSEYFQSFLSILHLIQNTVCFQMKRSPPNPIILEGSMFGILCYSLHDLAKSL